MEEIFKTIPSFPDYEVSNCGRVKTKSRQLRYVHARTGKELFRNSVERYLKIQYNNLTGYKFHQLYKDKKMHNVPIHRLVAETFIKKEKGKYFVNHIDGNKHNNRVDNLEWCTDAYNHHHATVSGLKAKGADIKSSKLNDRCIYAIEYLLSLDISHSQISKAFKVSRSSITNIANGKSWKHITGTELEFK